MTVDPNASTPTSAGPSAAIVNGPTASCGKLMDETREMSRRWLSEFGSTESYNRLLTVRIPCLIAFVALVADQVPFLISLMTIPREEWGFRYHMYPEPWQSVVYAICGAMIIVVTWAMLSRDFRDKSKQVRGLAMQDLHLLASNLERLSPDLAQDAIDRELRYLQSQANNLSFENDSEQATQTKGWLRPIGRI